MQASQRTNIVQLDVTIGHISTLLKMVEHIRHVMIAEHVRDIAVLIKVQLMLVLRFYHNLSNRRTHPPIHPLHNLLIYHHHHHHLNKLIHSLTLPSLQKIITAYSEYVKSGVKYNFKVVMDVNGSGLTLMFKMVSVKIVEKQLNYSTKTTRCTQVQVALIFHH